MIHGQPISLGVVLPVLDLLAHHEMAPLLDRAIFKCLDMSARGGLIVELVIVIRDERIHPETR